MAKRLFNSPYSGDRLNHVAFPLGGIGAGMFCLEGTGALTQFSLRGHPAVYNEPQVFSALHVSGRRTLARVLEGPVPSWKVFGLPGTANGAEGKTYGLPRFAEATFDFRFPFATVRLEDPHSPVSVEVTGWSPFTPGDADASSLPVAALEYRLTNTSRYPVEGVYSFHARNFMATRKWGSEPEPTAGDSVAATRNGFVLQQSASKGKPWTQGAFGAFVDDPRVRVNCAWFRGGFYDSLTRAWETVERGLTPEAGPIAEGEPSPGASLYVPFSLEPGEHKDIHLALAWYVPETDIRLGRDPEEGAAHEPAACAGACSCTRLDGKPDLAHHKPWYAGAFADVEQVIQHWRSHYADLRARSEAFGNAFYDTDMPAEVVEAVGANLAILKSPTVLRQTDGRLWCWEGASDECGCCTGSCTHVWNYAQAICHLFPDLERSLRQTEFNENQDARGHQNFRANLPIRPVSHHFHAAADGQLGGIIKIYRDWRISGDTEWLRGLWPRVKQSLEYCIATWDPQHCGALREPHHNTYDIEFWGPDGMCTSVYLGALKAAIAMAGALGEDAALWGELLAKGRALMESDLWNGEYFYQRVEWEGLQMSEYARQYSSLESYSPEAREVARREGPKYQYGHGCLSDGVIGAWLAEACGLGDILDATKVRSHLRAVHAHNLKRDLSTHTNPQRPSYAIGHEGGLLLCTWPRGGKPSLPMVYSHEVWTGIEYQVASHLIMMGLVEEGLEVVRAIRSRYDGRVRNPFDEYECGHWYGRALASYALLQALSGVRYDAADKVLYVEPPHGKDVNAFLCTATGFGTAGVRNGQPFLNVRQGEIPCERIVYRPKDKGADA